MKMLRDQPYTLQVALGAATNEQNLRTRVQISYRTNTSSNHTTMEVDHSQGQYYEHRQGYNRVNSLVNTQVKCWHCGRLGHMSR